MADYIQTDLAFGIMKSSPLDVKQHFVTIAEMAAFDERFLSATAITTCDEDGNLYLYNVNNDVDLVTGKWRTINGLGQTESEDLDFSTFDVNLPTATDEEMALLYTTLYDEVFNDPSYVEGDIRDPEMKALYDNIYNKVFGTT